MRLLSALLLGLVLCASPAQGQSVSASYEGNGTASTTATIANVNASGSGLIVVVGWRQNAGQTISSITHGATNLAACDSVFTGAGIGLHYWFSTSASGSQTVTVTMSANAETHVYAVVLTGSHASAPCAAATQSGTSVTAAAMSTSVTSTGLLLSTAFVRDQVAASLAPDAGQTELQELQDANFTSGISSEGGSGSITSGYTWTGSVNAAILNIPIAAAAGGGGGTNKRRMLLGVGP